MPTLDVAINARRAQQGAQQFDSAVKKVKRGAGTVDKSVKANTKSFTGLGSQMKTVVTGMIGLAAAYKGLRLAQTAVKEMALFEMELANVSTMLDDQTMRYLPKYGDQLSSLAVKYGQSTATLSKGLYDILSASIKASDAIEVLEVASKAAIGGLTDTGTAADALTTIINAYGMEAKDAARISDILFATVKRGKLTFGELAGSIGKVIALAAAAGLSFEQASAAIATMTRAGISADIAMTSLKGIVTTFLSPQKENIEMAKKFGLELNTTTLQTIGLTGALEKLRDATAEETAAMFSNVRALLGVAATRKSLNALVEDYEGVLNSAGMAEIAYQKIAATTQHQLEQNRELWKGIKRDLGEGIQPQVNLWLQGMKLLVSEWRTGWQIMVSDQNLAMEQINKNMGALKVARLIPAFNLLERIVAKVYKGDIEFADSMLQVDEAIKKVNESTTALAIGLDKIDKREVKIAEISLGDGEEIEKLTEAQKKASHAMWDLFKELEIEKRLIGKTTEERERAIKVLEFEKLAKINAADNAKELVADYEDELKGLQKLYIEAEKSAEFYRKIEEGMAGIVRSPLTALLDETRDIGDVLEDELRNLGTRILESMYEELITKPLTESLMKAMNPVFEQATNMISQLLGGIVGGITSGIGSVIGMAIPGMMGLGGAAAAGATGATSAGAWSALQVGLTAKGDVLSGGSLARFAKGDILTRPTIFPMSNGGVGLAGEAGKEAIMPLGRDKSGRLGVRTGGNEGAGTPIKIINVMDQSAIQEYLGTGDGERQIVNIMRRNSHEVQEIVS